LQSHQQWRSASLSPHPHQHLLSPEVWLVWGRILGLFWFEFHWWLRMLTWALYRR
jgi:hypothetical protein